MSLYTKNSILPLVFCVFSIGCTVTKAGDYNKSATLLNLLAAGQTQAYVYISNSSTSSFGINPIQAQVGGGFSTLPEISSSVQPAGLIASGIGTGHVLSTLSNSNIVQIIQTGAQQTVLKTIPVGTNPLEIVVDPNNTDHHWTMNNGNASGIDSILCSSEANPNVSSISVVHDDPDPVIIAYIHASICVGKGAHKVAFQTVSPFLALVTNQSDNTVSVIDDDSNSPTFLGAPGINPPDTNGGVLRTITVGTAPLNVAYSSFMNLFYVYNTGAGTISVIDPNGNSGTGALLGSSLNVGKGYTVMKTDVSGRYLILSGTDTTTYSSLAYGILRFLDLADPTGATFGLTRIPKAGFSDFQQSPDGKRLFVASAVSGTSTQISSINSGAFYIFDSSSLPNPSLLQTAMVGSSNQSYRTFSINAMSGSVKNLFVPNYSDGTVTIIDGMSYNPLTTVSVNGNPTYSTIFQPGGADALGGMGGMGGMSGM
ncbi:putative lipoprotein [Leptospira broomii serovar Hurstbridge str. 5399]|uniref:Lipoprotein n=1 Tax=Leptospira broomii serovar Hurstbridge str. 5399 TaxID=1049789 RepID=T0GEX8_9LEPT|nr:hypothetical protein [Leptospira broomii]EQA43958.1 putative lipoprotein [Leptospira broomii serovar Hurstbridge str. 5399]